MQRNLERSRQMPARSDKRFSLPAPRSLAGTTDKTICVVPDVPLQKCANKAAAKEVYHSIAEKTLMENEPLQLVQSPGLLLLVHLISPGVALSLQG